MDWSGFEVLGDYVKERITEFDQIHVERKEALKQVAIEVRAHTASHHHAEIVFICTHNSRRSHMGHLWAQLAAGYYGIGYISCYSGGTEATAIYPRAVKALEEAGMTIERMDHSHNPFYRVTFPGLKNEITVFSKKYTDPPNPTDGFIAVMTCSEADEACPIVSGATSRYAIRYEDPKAYDGTHEESVRYKERLQQISREMLFLFSNV